MRTPPRLLGLGDNTIDTYVSLGREFPGGNAVNVAVLARRRGAAASYLGCWGDDAGGALLRDALRAEGVDLSHVRVIAGGETARARIAHFKVPRVWVRVDELPRNAAGKLERRKIQALAIG